MTIEIELPPAADFHVHLRDGDMMKTVTPTITHGGVSLVYVMPNLVPPLTSPSDAVAYVERLQAVAPDVTYLSTLYLHPSITPAVVEEAAVTGIAGIKSYPRGATTNSDAGVLDYEQFYPVFQAMSDAGLVLNIHGECPPTPDSDAIGLADADVTVLNGESKFLPTLKMLHEKFPDLRIVLEHVTTAEAVEVVQSCGDNVAATITPHHLYLTVDRWADDPHAYCKPVAKLPSDRSALLAAATSGSKKFFLGSDSAPHPKADKMRGGAGSGKTVAGVFTQPYVVQFVAEAFDKVGKADKETLEGFCCRFGREFYKVKEKGFEKEDVFAEGARRIVLRKSGGENIPEVIGNGGDKEVVVPFRAGAPVWSLGWKNVKQMIA